MKMTKRWVRITAVENIPLREGRAVQVGACEIAIFNLGDRILTIHNRCPHKGGPLAEGIVSGTTVVCPLHAWKINLETGAVANAPNVPPCVDTFHTRVDDGFIFIELPVAAKTNGEAAGASAEQGSPGPWLESSPVAVDDQDLRNIGA